MSARKELAAAFKAALLDKIEWRCASVAAEEGQVSVVAAPGHRAAAIFKGGEWRNDKGGPLKFVPTCYMVFTDA